MSSSEYKTYSHNPPHLFIPNAKYFITAATYLKKPYIADYRSKDFLLYSLQTACHKYNWVIEDWVVLDNHYHLMLNAPENVASLSTLINDVHKYTAGWIKKHIGGIKDTGKIFYNYRDSCITYESSYFSRLNYIYFNPIKHGYTKEAAEYKWGSYYQRVKDDAVYLASLKTEYPYDKLNIKDDF